MGLGESDLTTRRFPYLFEPRRILRREQLKQLLYENMRLTLFLLVQLITHAYLCPFLTNDWNYPRLLSEIARCLKPGGVYFCVDKHTVRLL